MQLSAKHGFGESPIVKEHPHCCFAEKPKTIAIRLFSEFLMCLVAPLLKSA